MNLYDLLNAADLLADLYAPYVQGFMYLGAGLFVVLFLIGRKLTK